MDHARQSMTLARLATGLALSLIGTRITSAASLDDLPGPERRQIAEAVGRDQPIYLPRVFGDDRVHLQNPTHDVGAEITGDHVTMVHGSLRWELALRRWGRDGLRMPLPCGRVDTHANRVDVERGPIVEWYVNGPLGLEQGFTVRERPSPDRDGPLVLEQASGGAVTLAARDRETIEVVGADGSPRLQYGGLTAFDADSRALPVEMRAVGTTLEIRVDDRGARYPIIVDPFVQVAKLIPKKPEIGGDFAQSIAIDGDTIVVGAPYTTIGDQVNQGAVYVFVRSPNGWTSMKETARLTSSEDGSTFLLGLSVDIDGDTIVASADQPIPGAAYVFVKPPGGWTSSTETGRLTASDAGVFDEDFGNTVAIDGDTIVVGAPLVNNDKGAAYVFVKPPGGWITATETAKLTAAAAVDNDLLGHSVAVSGDTIVAGAPFSFLGTNTGKALVFVRPMTGWTTATETATLTPSDGAVNDTFGTAVAIDGDTIAVGSPRHDVGPDTNVGAVYVYVAPGGGWVSTNETATLVATNAAATDIVGYAVSVSGSRIAAGAPNHDGSRGAVFVFDEPGGGWAPVAESGVLVAADRTVFDQLGVTVDLDGAIVAGANSNDLPKFEAAGTGYVYEDVPSAVVCPSAPSVACVSAGQGKLDLKYDLTKLNGDKFKWKFSAGPELHLADFGDAATNTSYTLCVYDDGALALSAGVFPGFARWATKGDGYKYSDPNHVAYVDGVQKAMLKGGLAGRSSLSMMGKGDELGVAPLLGMPGPTSVLLAQTLVQAQLHQTGGNCYETSFTPSQVKKNVIVDFATAMFQSVAP